MEIGVLGGKGTAGRAVVAELEQEAAVLNGPVPGSVVRATQFMELFDMAWGATRRAGVIPALRGVVAPIAPAQVAVVLADVAEGEPAAQARWEVRGDEAIELRELARRWRRRQGSRGLVLPVPAVGGSLKAIASGALVSDRAQTVTALHQS